MHRFLISIALVLGMAWSASAQDSVFTSRDHMQDFIWDKMRTRDFIPLIQRLGGRDEYTTEQLANIDAQFLAIYRENFTDLAQVAEKRLENGFRQEVVAFWTGLNYAWMYLMTHEINGRVVVITFRLNSEVGPVMEFM